MKAYILKHTLICTLALFCLVFLLPIHAIAGYILDPSFGNAGVQVNEIGDFDDQAFAAALQSDGKVVVVGSSNNSANTDIAVLRYNSDGSLDTSFNSNGIATFPEIGSNNDSATGVVVLENGNILVTGYSENDDGDKEIVVLRITPAGFLDVSFGVSGVTRLEITDTTSQASAIVVDSQNRVLVSGTLESESTTWAVAVRFLENGTLDSDFGDSGYRRIEFTDDTDNTAASFIALQSDEKIILGGDKNNWHTGECSIVQVGF